MELTLPRLPSIQVKIRTECLGLRYSIPESERTALCPIFSVSEAPEAALQLPTSLSLTGSLQGSLAIHYLHLISTSTMCWLPLHTKTYHS